MAIELAEVLDALIGDQEATQTYASFVLSQAQSGKLLELACGTGALASVLKSSFEVEGLDHDAAMLKQFSQKNPDCVTHHRSMTQLQGLGTYDVILCFGDSLNYLTDDHDVDELFKQVDGHLRPGGVFLFDLHTEARLEEFENEFIEEGMLGEVGYQWTIQTLPDQLIDHQLTFYDASGSFTRHQIIQRVYPLADIKTRLKRFNWSIRVFSDFNEGIDAQAEKYLLVCTKENT